MERRSTCHPINAEKWVVLSILDKDHVHCAGTIPAFLFRWVKELVQVVSGSILNISSSEFLHALQQGGAVVTAHRTVPGYSNPPSSAVAALEGFPHACVAPLRPLASFSCQFFVSVINSLWLILLRLLVWCPTCSAVVLSHTWARCLLWSGIRIAVT